ncbi:putative cyclic nucleotide-gated ion channel 3 [Glycine soja]|uniref:Putative cyclic nucleotide-gated ion channel 3 n=1 Tax=Glycine soja TaxID=3848 RepID=A0A445H479_GLYSO|nr:putative cyclic nucleotide-gated ion channel 3 [Glycine soja]
MKRHTTMMMEAMMSINKMMKELCEDFKIQHHDSTPYRSKMKGAVKDANKNIKKIIQKMIMTYKDWHEMLSFAWHDYQNSRRTFTGATLFLLVCRMEVVLFFEVEIPYLKVLSEAKVEEVEWAQVSQHALLWASEARLTGAFSKGGKCAESPPTFICGKRQKNRRKPVKKNIPSSGVVFTFEEARLGTSHIVQQRVPSTLKRSIKDDEEELEAVACSASSDDDNSQNEAAEDDNEDKQKYLQSTSVRVEEMRVKRRDAEQWMSHHMLPDLLKERIRRVKFYFVDVNKVPQTLVKRGNISVTTSAATTDVENQGYYIGAYLANDVENPCYNIGTSATTVVENPGYYIGAYLANDVENTGTCHRCIKRDFTKFSHADYLKYKSESRIVPDGVNAKLHLHVDEISLHDSMSFIFMFHKTQRDVSSIGACRPRIFFINGFICFLEDEWQRNGEGRERGDATSRRR